MKMSVSSDSIIHKLFNRQVHGTFKYKHMPQNNTRYLFKDNPDYGKFFLQDILEDISDHVFLGLTRCGRFLLTYSIADSENIVIVDGPLMSSLSMKYKLHFWAFRPGQTAIRVSEIILFENAEFSEFLNVYIVQWPNRSDRIVVFGESVTSEDDDSDMHKIYITVTTLPSLSNCKDCQSVAREHRDEDISKYYLGNTCLVHGLTVHTSFTVSHPYPQLEPSVSLKYDDHIVLNTCNFIHVLNIDLDKNQNFKPDKSENINVPLVHKLSNDLTEFGYKMANKSDNQERGVKRRHIDTRCFFDKEQDLPIAALNPMPNYNNHRLLRMKDAEKVYDFDENDDNCLLKFKWFRRRRIADKMYEFCPEEEDMENVHPSSKKSLFQRCESPGPSAVDQTPLYIQTDYEDDILNDCDRKMLFAQELNAIIADWDCLSSPRSVTSEDRDIKSPDSTNRKITNVLKPRNKTPLFKNSKSPCDKKISVMIVPDNIQGNQSSNSFRSVPLQGCSVKFERQYIEVDEEIVSVTTDLDEEDGITGSLCALPLSVHGSASAQMQMINTAKIGKQEKNVCVVKQASLDFEHVSYKVAEIICNLEGHKFWCYNDYDSSIVDICPLNGDILIVLCIRLNTEEEKKPIPICQPANSRGFETKCVILWNPETDTCYLEAYLQLELVTEDPSQTSWNPARFEANILRKASMGFFNVPTGRQVRCLSHEVWSKQVGNINPPLLEIRDEDNMITILRNRLDAVDENNVMVFLRHRQLI
ncbi:uncharacterized protein LOC113552289 [Rhopalosiphum maidis]|uniref:uncharacterized protein LOC113552289 n=1 Tax=Rhopalosiphum maidis TaxID=43146 RepID=UPI000F0007B3|nr:uncharacterized protein LOC113552289 [Rhopalosiphum maidis]XP_026810893.1 uncharacterized protein LOC113552289 [Rhopalosiphum maidis]